MKDILQDNSLKKMPYKVPDGYFEGLKVELKTISRKPRVIRPAVWKWSVAAAITALIAVGALLSGSHADSYELTEEDYIVYSGEMTDIIYEEFHGQYADASVMSEDDIIEYLIYSGMEVEEIEQD